MSTDDGMPDLGNLPIRTKAIRNKLTGQIQTPDSLARGVMNEGEEDPWTMLVRFAYAHQDSLELLDYVPDASGKRDPIKSKDDDSDPGLPTLEDGRIITYEVLGTIHWQTLRKLAKRYGGNPDGKGKKQVLEMIVNGAYTDADLPVPAVPAL